MNMRLARLTQFDQPKIAILTTYHLPSHYYSKYKDMKTERSPNVNRRVYCWSRTAPIMRFIWIFPAICKPFSSLRGCSQHITSVVSLLFTFLCCLAIVIRPISELGRSSAFLALTLKELVFSVQGVDSQLETTALQG
jgi:hypothetical protein